MWQGWVVIVVFVVVLAVVAIAFPPPRRMGMFLGLTAIDTLALIAVCCWKGERPKWRWGPDGKGR